MYLPCSQLTQFRVVFGCRTQTQHSPTAAPGHDSVRISAASSGDRIKTKTNPSLWRSIQTDHRTLLELHRHRWSIETQNPNDPSAGELDTRTPVFGPQKMSPNVLNARRAVELHKQTRDSLPQAHRPVLQMSRFLMVLMVLDCRGQQPRTSKAKLNTGALNNRGPAPSHCSKRTPVREPSTRQDNCPHASLMPIIILSTHFGTKHPLCNSGVAVLHSLDADVISNRTDSTPTRLYYVIYIYSRV